MTTHGHGHAHVQGEGRGQPSAHPAVPPGQALPRQQLLRRHSPGGRAQHHHPQLADAGCEEYRG